MSLSYMKKSNLLRVSNVKQFPKSPQRDKVIGVSLHHYNHLLNEVKTQTILLWNYKALKILPKFLIQEASHIQQIYLKHNLLSKLPDNLGCLRNLTFLYLYGNNIEELPDSIGDIKTLNILDLSNNKLKSLGDSITKLVNLRSLVVSNNELADIPSGISNLKSLSILILTGNRLRSLPESVGELKALQGLYLDNNVLQTLPHTLVNLPLLAHLSCCHNYLVNLPSKPFASHPALFFDNNPDLNYLPFCLLKHLKIGDFYDPYLLPSYGCFSKSPFHSQTLQISYNGIYPDSFVIHIPTNLLNVSCFKRNKLNIPPLIELCLRYLKNENLDLSTFLDPGQLPSNLTQCLSSGSIIYCEGCQVSNIFTYASIIVLPVCITSQQGMEGQDIPAVIYFCSDACVKLYISKLSVSNDPYYSWLYRKLSSILNIEII